MSLAAIRSGVASALSALADAALFYRTGGVGSWVGFPSAVLNTDPAIAVGFDDDEGGETQMQTATLVAAPSTVLLSIGDQVKDYKNNVWAVLGLDLSVSVSTYRLRREILSDSAYGIDRGGREK